MNWSELLKCRSNRSEMFSRKSVLKIFSKFTGKHPSQSVISIKLQSNFIEIKIRHGCSPVNLLHIFKTPIPKKLMLMQAFVKGKDSLKFEFDILGIKKSVKLLIRVNSYIKVKDLFPKHWHFSYRAFWFDTTTKTTKRAGSLSCKSTEGVQKLQDF